MYLSIGVPVSFTLPALITRMSENAFLDLTRLFEERGPHRFTVHLNSGDGLFCRHVVGLKGPPLSPYVTVQTSDGKLEGFHISDVVSVHIHSD